MATLYPSHLTADMRNSGEREVFNRLRDEAGAEHWHVLHSLNLSRHVYKQMGEIDFVVIVPGKGLLVVEVKASASISFDGNEWHYGDDESKYSKRESPFVQAKENMLSIRDQHVRAHLSDLSGMAYGYCVVTTRSGPIRTPSAEWEPWHQISADKLMNNPLSALLLDVLDRWREKTRASSSTARLYNPKLPTRAQVTKLVQLLRPQFEIFEPPSVRAARRDAEIKHYTEEQFGALDAMSFNPRTLFMGPAGTGKTLLAIEAARRALADGKKVLLTCFNRPLAQRLRSLMPQNPRLTVNNLHAHLAQLVGGPAADPGPGYWELTLPQVACDHLLTEETGAQVYDEVIVDEAQDLMRDSYLDVLDLSVRGGLRGGHLRLFGDFDKQAIYGIGREELEGIRQRRLEHFVRYRLYANCRNPKPVAEKVMRWVELDPGYARILRPDHFGPPRVIVYEDPADQARKLARLLAELSPRTPYDDIVVLSTRARDAAWSMLSADWQPHLTDLESDSPGKIRAGTIHKFKGLEAPVVILTDLDTRGLSRDRSLLYVGMTRVLERLVLFVESGAESQLDHATNTEPFAQR